MTKSHYNADINKFIMLSDILYRILQGECVAVLLSILRQMTESHYNAYVNKFIMLSDMEDFLMEIMMLFQNLINSSVFQNDWVEMILLQNRYFSSNVFAMKQVRWIKDNFLLFSIKTRHGYSLWYWCDDSNEYHNICFDG